MIGLGAGEMYHVEVQYQFPLAHRDDLSAMLAGQFRGYSVERLMRFLVALGHDVEIVVKPRRRGAAELRVA